MYVMWNSGVIIVSKALTVKERVSSKQMNDLDRPVGGLCSWVIFFLEIYIIIVMSRICIAHTSV